MLGVNELPEMGQFGPIFRGFVGKVLGSVHLNLKPKTSILYHGSISILDEQMI